jgi:hypothetical protein
LKQDAVPSLFEIDVFEQMINHQEKVSIEQNQLNEKKNQQHQQIADYQSDLNINPIDVTNTRLSPLQKTIDCEDTEDSKTDEKLLSEKIRNSLNFKRPRMDQTTRQHLLERVPKAVRRTIPTVPLQQSHVYKKKPQMALKHTMPMPMPMPQLNDTPLVEEIPLSTSNHQNVFNKSKKKLKNNSPRLSVSPSSPSQLAQQFFDTEYLKEILPPPIMQSTKKSKTTNNNTGIKPNNIPQIFYQNSTKAMSKQQQNPTSQTATCFINKQSNSKDHQLVVRPRSGSFVSNNGFYSNHKITTTYVYKRVQQPPEIDLHMECEEEEIVYKYINETSIKSIGSPTPPPPPPTPQPQPPSPLSISIEQKEFAITKPVTFEIKNEQPKTATTPLVVQKEPTKFEKKIDFTQESIDQMTSADVYKNILSKFYCRKVTKLGQRLELFNKAVQAMKRGNLAKKYEIPSHLKIGKYPVDCQVCRERFINNIQLTSHICSHLEVNERGRTNASYISPFNAVTTSCSICDETFQHPFDLIKHLDIEHMKDIGEFKCRICEKEQSQLLDLLVHLNETHSENEMPYKCDACGFCTSFYADAIYHIKKVFL